MIRKSIDNRINLRENTALSSKNLSATILFQVGLPLFYRKAYPQPYQFARIYRRFTEKPIRNRIILRGATAVLPKKPSATVPIRENLPLFYRKAYPQPYHFVRGYPCFTEKPIRNRIILRGATAVLSKSLSATVFFREELPLFYRKACPQPYPFASSYRCFIKKPIVTVSFRTKQPLFCIESAKSMGKATKKLEKLKKGIVRFTEKG